MFYPCPSVHASHLKKVCIINYSYSFKAISLKLCTAVTDILKSCTSQFEEIKIDFYKIMAFKHIEILPLPINRVCITNSSYSLKLCTDVTDTLKMCTCLSKEKR